MGGLALIIKALSGAGLGAFVLGYFGIVKRFRFAARFTVYLILIVICALLGFAEGVTLAVVGKNGIVQYVTARTFYTLCRIFLGIKVEIKHKERLLVRPGVFVSNHQSMLDILVLGATFPKWCSVTAKKSLRLYPFLGWFMMATKTVFLDRQHRDKAIKTFDSAREYVLREQQSVFMFPEGTRSHSEQLTLLPFKKGAFHFAQQCQIPLVPYVVSNYSNLYSFKKGFLEPGLIEIEVLEPIETKGMTAADVHGFAEDVQAKMSAAAVELGYAKKF